MLRRSRGGTVGKQTIRIALPKTGSTSIRTGASGFAGRVAEWAGNGSLECGASDDSAAGTEESISA